MKPTLLVLAAGMTSRYGGMQQIDPVIPCGAVGLECPAHDAVAAGLGIVRQGYFPSPLSPLP